MQACDTVVKCPFPPLALCGHITPKHDQFITLYTLLTTPSVTASKIASGHVHGETVGILTILKLLEHVQEIGVHGKLRF